MAVAAAFACRDAGNCFPLVRVQTGTQPLDGVHQGFRERGCLGLADLAAELAIVKSLGCKSGGKNVEAGLGVEGSKGLLDFPGALPDGRLLRRVGLEFPDQPIEPARPAAAEAVVTATAGTPEPI